MMARCGGGGARCRERTSPRRPRTRVLAPSQGYPGAPITPHYDSLLVKVTARAHSFEGAIAKLIRALREHRIRGVSTNIAFLLNVLRHPAFVGGAVTTRFIEMYPEVLRAAADAQNRGEKMLRFLANMAVNGPEPSLGATGAPPTITAPIVPSLPLPRSAPAPGAKPPPKAYLRDIFVKQGAKAFAAAVRAHEGALIMDTTFRDAHQSLLATRVRTRDLLTIAPATREALAGAYSLENWGGATFDGAGAAACAECDRTAAHMRASLTFPPRSQCRVARSGHALPAGVPVGPPGRNAGSDPRHPLPDAAAGRQRGGLHFLPRQRRAPILRGGGAARHGRLSRV